MSADVTYRAASTPADFRRTRRMLPLTQRSLLDRRRGIFGWIIGVALYSILIVSFFPTVRDSDSFSQVLDDYPDAVKELLGGDAAFDLTSGPGFVNAEVFALTLPLLLAVVAIGFGASMGADQRSGLMDLLLSNPIPRRQVVLERALAMTINVSVIAGVVFLTMLLADPIVDLDIGVNALTAATTAVVLLVLLHGFIAMAVGAATGRRSIAIGVSTGVFAAGYLLNVAGGVVSALENVRILSPYYHALGSNPLLNGWAVGIGVLFIMCAAVLWATVVIFERKDIT